MSKAIKIILWMVFLALVVWLIVLQRDSSSMSESETIKIGFVGSLTGDLQTWGEEAKNSIALAVEEINASGGVSDKRLEVIYEDGKCNAATAVSAARKLIDIDQVKIIIPFCSQEALSIAPLALEEKIIEFVAVATIPEITQINEYVFRASPSDKVAAEILGEAISQKYSRLAILTENNDYSKSLRESLTKHYSGEVVLDESYNPGLRDFRSFVAKIKESNADSVLLNANTTVSAALMIKQMHDLGLDIPSYGVYFGSDPEFTQVAGVAGEGFTYVEFIADTNQGTVRTFLDAYKAKYGVEAPHPQFAALAYDAPYILKAAIEKVGTNPEKLKVYFKNLKSVTGTLGTFEIIDGDLSGTIFKLRTIKNGKPIDV